jgi:hypothetical protein
MGFKKGNVPWIKGKKGLASLKTPGKVVNGFQPGNKLDNLNKGVPKSEEWKRKASIAKMGDRNPMKNPHYCEKDGDRKER